MHGRRHEGRDNRKTLFKEDKHLPKVVYCTVKPKKSEHDNVTYTELYRLFKTAIVVKRDC